MKSFALAFLLFFTFSLSFAQEKTWEIVYKQADSIMQKRDFKTAIPIYEEALILAEKEFGKESEKYLMTRNGLGRSASYIWEKEKAIRFLEENLSLCKIFSEKSFLYAQALHNIGTFYLPNSIGNNVDSSGVYLLKAKVLRKEVLGENNLDYAATLVNLATYYKAKRKYTIAESYLLQAEKIRKQLLGNLHLDYAKVINDLAVLTEEVGNYYKAEELYKKVLAINAHNFGTEDYNYAQTLNNLGILNTKIGNFSRAEELFRTTAKIRLNTLGKNSKRYAHALMNLALVLHNKGNYIEAKKSYLQADEIYIYNKEENTLEYSFLLNNMALLASDLKQTSLAKITFNKSFMIMKNKLAHDDMTYIGFVNNLAVFYNTNFNFVLSDSLFRQSLNEADKVLGKKHNDYAFYLYNSALLDINLGKIDNAISKIKESLSIYDKNETINTLKYMWALDALAQCYNLKNDKEMYLSTQSKLFSAIEQKVYANFPTMTEYNKEFFFLNSLKSYLDLHKAILLSKYSSDLKNIYDYQLYYKAILLQSALKFKNVILNSNDSSLISTYNLWKQQKEELNKLNNMSASEKRTTNIDVDSLFNVLESVEKSLTKKSLAFASIIDNKKTSWQDIRKKLKKGEAAIELIRINKFGLQTIQYDSSDVQKAPNFPKYPIWGFTDTIYYAALIITKSSKQPELVLLKNGNDLEQKYANYQKNMVNFRRSDTLSYREFWQPIAAKLSGISKVYLSPDGVYNQISLNTLYNPATEKYLLEELDLHLVTNTKDLLTFGKRENKTLRAELLGYPIYDLANINKNVAKTRGSEEDSLRAFANFNEVALLPGTKKEVEDISISLKNKNFDVKVLTAETATEENIKKVHNPKILHISTHGFFINSKEKNEKINPMLRSGLLLTGVSDYARMDEKPDTEDGVLTALEAANLDLDDTDLVVLSACETGLGDVKAGEGVYGLQRAFKVAGAKTLVMSMWKVDDAVTQKLMSVFYQKYSATNNARQSFKEAQAEIKLAYPEPYYWGAFVMVGE